jgi:hypothetical protein
LSGADKEDLDALFDVSEYTQILQVIGKLAGGDDTAGKPLEMEMIVEG